MDTRKYVKLKEPCFLEFVTEGKSVNEAILFSKCTKYFDFLMIIFFFFWGSNEVIVLQQKKHLPFENRHLLR